MEFKLASNSKLRDNLENQVAVYSNANKTRKSVKVIIYFTAKQKKRALGILRDLKLEKEESVVLVDARKDNKISASKIKSKKTYSRKKMGNS